MAFMLFRSVLMAVEKDVLISLDNDFIIDKVAENNELLKIKWWQIRVRRAFSVLILFGIFFTSTLHSIVHPIHRISQFYLLSLFINFIYRYIAYWVALTKCLFWGEGVAGLFKSPSYFGSLHSPPLQVGWSTQKSPGLKLSPSLPLNRWW